MTNSPVRTYAAAAALKPYTFRNALGFDPFGSLRPNSLIDHSVSKTETGYDVEIPVPGYRPDQVEVTFKDGALSISGNTERRSFSRTLIVPDDIDEDRISGRIADGMLVLSLQRRTEAQPKRIALNASE